MLILYHPFCIMSTVYKYKKNRHLKHLFFST
nr:MAG TPA: hypothetical protein [Caudoviricetes sp.]